MTERLYYTDAYLTEFDATVVAVDGHGQRVTLDRTAFYPTSGGQPHDVGMLGNHAVADVIDGDDTIVHLLETPFTGSVGDRVACRVNWSRRYDHMQQHTAQHLLSALLADRYSSPTVSVHFGAESSTIDVAGGIEDEIVPALELLANEIVWQHRVVSVSFEDSATATGLRKPSDRAGELRIVTIDGIDRSACGGTHVHTTAELGSILLRRIERTRGNQRLEFLSGLRAVRAAREDYSLLARTSRLTSASPTELPKIVEAQQARLKEMERELRRVQGELAVHEAASLWNGTTPGSDGIRRVHLDVQSGQAREHQPVANAVAERGRAMVLVTSAATLSLLIAASDDTSVDASAWLKEQVTRLGGRGGGSRKVAQGTVPNVEALRSAVDAFRMEQPAAS